MDTMTYDLTIALACDVLEAFAAANKARAASVPGIEEFSQLYADKVGKLRRKGKLGPKAWAKLEAAMPAQLRPTFREFSGGFDLEDADDLARFMVAINNLGQTLPDSTMRPILSRYVGGVVPAMLGIEPESVDQDEDEDE